MGEVSQCTNLFFKTHLFYKSRIGFTPCTGKACLDFVFCFGVFGEEFLEPTRIYVRALKTLYRHYRVNRVTSKARRIVRQLFDIFFEEPFTLPTDWQGLVERTERRYEEESRDPQAGRARVICDYIAGMTDRYAMREYERLFDLSFQKNL